MTSVRWPVVDSVMVVVVVETFVVLWRNRNAACAVLTAKMAGRVPTAALLYGARYGEDVVVRRSDFCATVVG